MPKPREPWASLLTLFEVFMLGWLLSAVLR